jgi:hypothetical protein
MFTRHTHIHTHTRARARTHTRYSCYMMSETSFNAIRLADYGQRIAVEYNAGCRTVAWIKGLIVALNMCKRFLFYDTQLFCMLFIRYVCPLNCADTIGCQWDGSQSDKQHQSSTV